jgi:CYTH domain-containing protein
MATEIERKFLVFADKLPVLENGQHFIQGYLSLLPNVRYRMIDDQVIITIKKDKVGGPGRYEWEFADTVSDKEEREELKKLAVRIPIEKIRYKIFYQNLTWEIDVYQGENNGLITAEVELPSIDYQIIFPEWIDKENEVGHNPKYFNSNLGEYPYQSWV